MSKHFQYFMFSTGEELDPPISCDNEAWWDMIDNYVINIMELRGYDDLAHTFMILWDELRGCDGEREIEATLQQCYHRCLEGE